MSEPLKPPIFLLGNVRSGTSILHRFFDGHPQLTAWYEPRTVWTYADPARQNDRFDESDATERVVRYIRKRFHKYQRAHGDLRVMEKTPSNILRIPYVRKIFPQSKLLYIVREPLANLSSAEIRWRRPINRMNTLKRLRETPKTQLHHYLGRFVYDLITVKLLKRRYVSVWGVRYPGVLEDRRRLSVEQVIARQWVACSQYAERDLARIDPQVVLRLRYEDFVADPVHHFERILDHFELPATDELLEHVRQTIDPNRQNKWRRLDPQVLCDCVPILRDEMTRHGYSVPHDVEELIGE